MSDVLTLPQAEVVWDILVEEVGANPDKDHWMYYQFMRYVTTPEPMFGHEFRFQGALGFGGKFVNGAGPGWRVTCYQEDRTPERDAAIDRANARLAALEGEDGFDPYNPRPGDPGEVDYVEIDS